MTKRTPKKMTMIRLQTPFSLRLTLIALIECLISYTLGILMDRNYVNFNNLKTFGQLSKQM